MDIERQYLAALDLTHHMLSAAANQDWEALIAIERQRLAIMATIAKARNAASLDPALARRIAATISEIESESSAIIEHVQVWRKHVKILLRFDKPAVV